MDISKIKELYKEKKYNEIKSLLKNDLDCSNPDVQYILASIYNEEKDYDKAFIHFLRASELANAEAERALGIYYYQGFGCQPDSEKGLYWVKKSIEDGCVRALCTLAHIYMNGLGVKKDEHQGFLLYEEAALKGDDHALEHLIECYEKGIGVPINLEKANELKTRL